MYQYPSTADPALFLTSSPSTHLDQRYDAKFYLSATVLRYKDEGFQTISSPYFVANATNPMRCRLTKTFAFSRPVWDRIKSFYIYQDFLPVTYRSSHV
jgi:hypothetical protein